MSSAKSVPQRAAAATNMSFFICVSLSRDFPIELCLIPECRHRSYPEPRHYTPSKTAQLYHITQSGVNGVNEEFYKKNQDRKIRPNIHITLDFIGRNRSQPQCHAHFPSLLAKKIFFPLFHFLLLSRYHLHLTAAHTRDIVLQNVVRPCQSRSDQKMSTAHLRPAVRPLLSFSV